MAHDLILDPEDSCEAPRPKRRANFGTIGLSRKIKCSGIAGEPCKRAGIIKGGRLWYCHDHAPYGAARLMGSR